MMAIGEWMFGYIDCAGHPHGDLALGWRFSAAVFGTLAVLILARTARRMFRSTLIGCLAGLLMALDGLELVQSRTGLLDIFLMFWIVAGARRASSAIAIGDGNGSPTARKLGFWRPWRLTRRHLPRRGAMATKWTGLYAIIALSAVVLAWDIGARRSAGAARPVRRRPPAVTAPGWLLRTSSSCRSSSTPRRSPAGSSRTTATCVTTTARAIYNTWRAWWHWHQWAYDFHTTLDTRHPYQSDSPFQWLVQGRPTLFAYTSTPKGPLCHAASGCSSTVLDLGQPGHLVAGDPRRSSAACGCGSPVVTGAPRWSWWASPPTSCRGCPTRTAPSSDFYALPMLPFLILGAVRDGRTRARPAHRHRSETTVGSHRPSARTPCWSSSAFAYFYPIWTYDRIPYNAWHARIWFPGWF